jgi:hypothetical protein
VYRQIFCYTWNICLCRGELYLKSKDVKSKRVIIPKKIGKMDYNGAEFLGVEGYCTIRKDDRVFNVEKILEIKEIE